MKNTHKLGNVGEMRVAYEATKRGYIVSIPMGHDARYDIVIDRGSKLERVQVKTTECVGDVITVRSRSVGKKNGDLISKKYTKQDLDWLVIFVTNADKCYYIPAEELGEGMETFSLRVSEPKSSQRAKIRWARDYEHW